jgi:hypothetical protein
LQSVEFIVRHLFDNFPDVEIGYRIRSPNSIVGDWLYTFMYSWHQIKGFHHNGRYNT